MPYTLPSGRAVNLDPDTTGSGRPSDLPSNHPAGWTPAYGGAPNIPDPIASQWQALGGDLAALPNLFTLGNAYNLFNYDQRMGQISGTPGFDNVLSNLGGVLPQDVVNQIAQRSAERGISSGGAPDSPNTSAAYLRALGLNSLDLQNRGQEQYGNLLGHFQGAAPFDLSSFLVTPEQQQAANTAANASGAAPNPQAAAQAELDALLKSIEAGKATGGAGGPIGSGGVDLQKILDAWRASQNSGGAGTTVGSGSGVNRGNPAYNPGASSLPPNYRPYSDPGSTGSNGGMIQPDRGRPNDVISNAFNSPDLSDAGVLGGVGLNPQLNSLLGNGGMWGHLNSRDFANYSGGSNNGTGPWNNPAGTVTNNYTNYTPSEWAQFGNEITVPDLSYSDTNSGAFDGSHGGVNPNNYTFGTPITSRNLYTGNQTATPEEIAMLLGLIPEMPQITPNDRSQFGNPITFEGLLGGGNPNEDILDFLDTWG